MRIRVFIGLFFCLSLTSIQTLACSLSFAVSGSFPPYHVLQANGEWGGLGVDLFRVLAKQVDCSVEVVDIPWERAVGLLALGEVDATSNLSLSAERQKFAYFIGPQHMEKIVAIVDQKLSDELSKPLDLLSFSGAIGKTQGSYYGRELEEIIARPEVQKNLVQITSNVNRVGMMLAGRFDAVLEEESVARHLYSTGVFNEPTQVMKLNFSTYPVFFGLSRGSISPELAARIALAWTDLISSEQIIGLYQRYGLSYSSLPAPTSILE